MAIPPETQPDSLHPSLLGTKEYWEDHYTTDLNTHAHTRGHIGQVWFEESGAEERTIEFLERSGDLAIDPTSATVLDLGTGNASMLTSLREEGWGGHLWGVDYSAASVRLARRIVGEWGRARLAGEELDRGEDAEEAIHEAAAKAARDAEFDDLVEPALGIHIVQHDLLADWPPSDTGAVQAPAHFDLVHDKGTFDAISLSTDASTACPLYRSRVEALVRPGGLLLITSCNWTEDELERWISGDGNGLLQRVGRIGYSRFKFGGQEGGVLSGLCWQRRKQ